MWKQGTHHARTNTINQTRLPCRDGAEAGAYGALRHASMLLRVAMKYGKETNAGMSSTRTYNGRPPTQKVIQSYSRQQATDNKQAMVPSAPVVHMLAGF